MRVTLVQSIEASVDLQQHTQTIVLMLYIFIIKYLSAVADAGCNSCSSTASNSYSA